MYVIFITKVAPNLIRKSILLPPVVEYLAKSKEQANTIKEESLVFSELKTKLLLMSSGSNILWTNYNLWRKSSAIDWRFGGLLVGN
ncbi:hypothetical protein MKX01_037301 [Papaver californicum]|nr:hypothetical protein MKX01_037301 [Papaver californicum]